MLFETMAREKVEKRKVEEELWCAASYAAATVKL